MNSTLNIGRNSPGGAVDAELGLGNIDLSITEAKTDEVFKGITLGNISGQVTPNRLLSGLNNSEYSPPIGRPPSTVVSEVVSSNLPSNEVTEKLKIVATLLEGTLLNSGNKADETPPPCLSPGVSELRPNNPPLSGKFSNSGNSKGTNESASVEGRNRTNTSFNIEESKIGCNCTIS